MKPNPYAWQSHYPRRPLMRSKVGEIVEHLRRGAAVKITGGHGMGKSVLLQQIQNALKSEAGTRVVLVDSAPEEPTVPAAVHDLAVRLGIGELNSLRMDDLLERVLQRNVMRLVVLFDEVDQYVALGGADGTFARVWLNKLEAMRKQWESFFTVVVAGGLGLLYLENGLGSALVGRAEKCVLEPFGLDEIAELSAPFEEDGRPLNEACLATLLALSGGSPALTTYGLEQLWKEDAPTAQMLDRIFGAFAEDMAFRRTFRNSIFQRGQLGAPERVLEVVRHHAGAVSAGQLRAASAPGTDTISIDYKQAIELLRAAGLVRLEGSASADPVTVWPIPSILNLSETPAGAGGPIERLIQDVCSVLAELHRFGRDFHHRDKIGLLDEQVFSSFIAVALRLLGWRGTEREAVQAGGYTDIKVRLTRPDLDGHVLIEPKIWRQESYNKGIQKQVDDYRLSDTRHGIAITLGLRGVDGWPEDYERVCLAGCDFERLEPPRDLVARWRVRAASPCGGERLTEDLLVQIPKRR